MKLDLSSLPLHTPRWAVFNGGIHIYVYKIQPRYLVIERFNGSERGKIHIRTTGQDLNVTDGYILLMFVAWRNFYNQLIISFNIASETF